MRSKRNNRRGVILVIALWLLAALSLLVLSLAYRLSLEGKILRQRLSRAEMLELARAAATLAKARIERADRDSTFYGQSWARPMVLDERDFSDLADAALARCRVEAVVFDELAKLNVNSATRWQLTSLGVIDDDLASAIIDWRDQDEFISEGGAESRYYGSLSPPFLCKNAPLESLWELLLVRDVTPELFGGPRAEAMVRRDLPDWQYRPMGLQDLLTTAGWGQINLNTAWPEVLMAIPGLDGPMVESIIYRRAGPDGLERTADDERFESFEQLLNVGAMTEFAIRQAEMHCVLTSDFFHVRVWVTDRRSADRLSLDVDLERTDEGVEIVYWRES